MPRRPLQHHRPSRVARRFTPLGGERLESRTLLTVTLDLFADVNTGRDNVIADILPGGNSSNPAELTPINGQLLFAAFDGVRGHELYRSSGTTVGTVALSEIFAGVGSSRPGDFTKLKNRVLFTANDGVHGRELWSYVDVNVAPSFVKGANLTVADDGGSQTVVAWATAIVPGPPDEAGQDVGFIVQTDRPDLFSQAPAIASNGTLTFMPAPNARGLATITVQLQDNGGTANGGIGRSPTQTFTIDVTKPLVWRNTANPLNVDANTGPAQVTPFDAVLIINYLNANTGGGPIPVNSPLGPPYLDVDGSGAIGPNDAVQVINWLNANPPTPPPPSGEGEASLSAEEPTPDGHYVLPDELLAMLAFDALAAPAPRRKF